MEFSKYLYKFSKLVSSLQAFVIETIIRRDGVHG